jgi:hypothetical protein
MDCQESSCCDIPPVRRESTFLFVDQHYIVLDVSNTAKESRLPKVVLPGLRRNEVWFYLCNRLSTKPPDCNPSLLWNDIVVCVVMLLRMEAVFIGSIMETTVAFS